MAKVLIDTAYLLKLTEFEASVLRSTLAQICPKDTEYENLEFLRDVEDALIGMHDALVSSGVEEADTFIEVIS
jgi:hypothetical protein